MKWILGCVLSILFVGRVCAQDEPVHSGPRMWDTTTISVGIGSTILPTPVIATRRLGDGGGGIIGGNITLNTKISREVMPNLRIPFSVSLGYLRGQEPFRHHSVNPHGDTVADSRLITNTCDILTMQIGAEYITHRDFVSPYAGIDFAVTHVGTATFDYGIPAENASIIHQTNPAAWCFGAVMRAGAEFPVYGILFYDVSAELGAVNLFGRPSGNDPTNGQLFTPTKEGRDIYASRNLEGKSGEAIVTYFRLLVKLAVKL